MSDAEAKSLVESLVKHVACDHCVVSVLGEIVNDSIVWALQSSAKKRCRRVLDLLRKERKL